MTGITGWIILAAALAALLLLGLVPVGAYASYDGALTVKLRVGPLPVTLYPQKGKKKKKRPPGKKKSGEEPKEKRALPKLNREQLRYSLQVLPPLLAKAISRTRRRILLSPLRLTVVFGGEDPADTAALYGKAEALLGALYPALTRLIRVRDDAVNLYTDYDSGTTSLKGEIGVRILLGDIALVGLSAAAGLVQWLVGLRRRAGKGERRTDGTKKGQANAA